MTLRYFVSCWGNEVDHIGALSLANAWGADGIEGPAPKDEANTEALRTRHCPWIAEVVTGGNYVPKPHLNVAQHLDDLRRNIEQCLPFAPCLINALAGSDAWLFADKVRFFTLALELEDEFGVPISFEIHRSRPMFHPWVARDLLGALPDLKVTSDFSHWCAVTERLVMDEEPELLELIAGRTRHIHARVGYEQGPQAPDPRAPEYSAALAAHLRWWQSIVSKKSSLGHSELSLTPEFGPDGYLHCEPFTQRPCASLQDLNHWMMRHLKDVMTRTQSSYDFRK